MDNDRFLDILVGWIKNLYNPQEITEDGLDAVMINQFLYNLNYYDPITVYIEKLYEYEQNRVVFSLGGKKYIHKESSKWYLSTNEDAAIKFVKSVVCYLYKQCQQLAIKTDISDAVTHRTIQTIQFICGEVLREDEHDFLLIALVRAEKTLARLYQQYYGEKTIEIELV